MQHSQSIIGMASNEYELASPVLTLKIEDAKKLIAKWVDRYHLLDTPQQTYRRRLNGEPVFSLSVYFYFNMKGADEDQKWQAFTTFEESCTQLAKVQLFCRSNDVFLYDDESNKVLDIKDKKDIPKINRKIEKLIPSSEKFDFLGNLEIINRHYELVRITKPKKSIKELKAQAWEQTKHATDWTWRLTEQAYKDQCKQGERVVLRFQNLIEKQASLEEKSRYFERHFRALEGFLGYRGVRQQIGTMYHQERRLFKSKYNADWSNHGARKLNLSYLKKIKNNIPNNSLLDDAFEMSFQLQAEHVQKQYQNWLKKNEAK
ncbi:hypothetical protein [Acinetobacter bereziniae]|jgi:hypothetical protein|uniref:hypothetical protein n=1 Tax=Acinetobacter bereziniae TaxID=106648 RepID=UPI0020C5F0B5|nr:hypothetical protein [Acinetobacter bereziniae]